VFFSPHPNAKDVSKYTIQILNKGIIDAGGPENLLTSVSEPSIEVAQYMMTHPKINILLVTGGPGVVKAAMKSGKKVIAAGPGNPPVVVDETADLEQAAKDIVRGASLDNNIVCIAEKIIIAVSTIADKLKKCLCNSGGIELEEAKKEAVLKLVFENYDPNKSWKDLVINKEMIGKDASLFLQKIQVAHDSNVRMIFIEVGKDHPLVLHEQMMPVIPFVRVNDVDEAIDLAVKVEHGFRHTSVMHSRNIRNLSKMANLVDTTIFVKNGPSFAGLGLGGEGVTSFSIAGPTGEGLTTAKTFTRKRRCVLVDYFRII
ncbi:aldehyde dehydrogenase, partial [bacterium]|nr:aldehyde dehydrogenase [bacterium]